MLDEIGNGHAHTRYVKQNESKIERESDRQTDRQRQIQRDREMSKCFDQSQHVELKCVEVLSKQRSGVVLMTSTHNNNITTTNNNNNTGNLSSAYRAAQTAEADDRTTDT